MLSRAVLRMLNPIVQILLRYEISHSEFSELTKRAYVNVAFKYFSIPNRIKTNSRVSVITGLSRKEIVRINNIDLDEPPQTKGPLNRANRVIGGWLADEDFTDENKQPRQLLLREGKSSFEALVERYSGGTTYRAILDELERVGAVTVVNNNSVALTHSGYIPSDNIVAMTDVVSTHAADLLSTIVHNLNAPTEARFQRQVTYSKVSKAVAEEFEQLSRKKCESLILELNAWLSSHSDSGKTNNTDSDTDEETTRVGVGIYYFKNKRDEE